MALSIFDPFSTLDSIWDIGFPGFGSFMEYEPPAIRPRRSSSNRVASDVDVDWKSTPDAHIFKVDLPGLSKEDVKVEVVDGNVLQITGQRRKAETQPSDRWQRAERRSGEFVRRFRLPDDADTDHIKATMENGVLTVVVPKKRQPRPEVRTIEVA